MMEVYKLKEVAADWRSFGTQLGVPYSELKGMDTGKLSLGDCMEQLLSEWIATKGDKANISGILQACRNVGNYSLAQDLENNPDVKKIMSRSELYTSSSLKYNTFIKGYS